jgi:hypothetical protein
MLHRGNVFKRNLAGTQGREGERASFLRNSGRGLVSRKGAKTQRRVCQNGPMHPLLRRRCSSGAPSPLGWIRCAGCNGLDPGPVPSVPEHRTSADATGRVPGSADVLVGIDAMLLTNLELWKGANVNSAGRCNNAALSAFIIVQSKLWEE